VPTQRRHDDDTPVFVISVAAELAGMHAQTLRQYDRLGLVTPQRTRGGGRRYSARDITRLREVQRLSQEEGISLAGIQRIMAMEHQIEALRSRVAELTARNEDLEEAVRGKRRIFAAGSRGDVVVLPPGTRPQQRGQSTAVVVWRPQS
jgi:MerR family transcriptional regulator/heat shock protein HspR